MQPLLDARELLFASKADEAADAFRSLTKSYPDLTVEMIEVRAASPLVSVQCD